MLSSVKQPIVKLIAAYETEKSERMKLQQELDDLKIKEATKTKQILELEKTIDNLKLSAAFKTTTGNGVEAKKKVNALLKEIDKCIKLIEG